MYEYCDLFPYRLGHEVCHDRHGGTGFVVEDLAYHFVRVHGFVRMFLGNRTRIYHRINYLEIIDQKRGKWTVVCLPLWVCEKNK